jgi:phosphate:Na+ symporter
MYGMKMMSGAVSPLADMPEFTSILTAFQNPLLGVLVGTVFTGIIQSSAASVGILQALSLTGSVTYGMAIPIIMGQNIGTCVTALLSSIGTSRNAKRVAVIHILFNLIGTVAFLIVLLALNALFRFAIANQPIDALGIAVCHSVFNVVTTVMLLPFKKQIESLSRVIIPVTAAEHALDKPIVMLDDRLLLSPTLAVTESFEATRKMSALAHQTVLDAMGLVLNFDQSVADGIPAKENDLDKYEDKLGTFLVKIASVDLSMQDSREVSKMLHNIGDFERLGDHALNICESALEMRTKDLAFSEEAQGELAVLTAALTEILSLAHAAYENDDTEKAALVEPLEQVIDVLTTQIKRRHVERLQCGKCTIELGFVLSDILANCERISDHCSNIAVCVEESDRGSFDTHEYLNAIKTGNDEQFRVHYEEFARKYELMP